jgi:hypothetical protein
LVTRNECGAAVGFLPYFSLEFVGGVFGCFLEDFICKEIKDFIVVLSLYSMIVELPLSALEMIAWFRFSLCLTCLMVLDSMAGW